MASNKSKCRELLRRLCGDRHGEVFSDTQQQLLPSSAFVVRDSLVDLRGNTTTAVGDGVMGARTGAPPTWASYIQGMRQHAVDAFAQPLTGGDAQRPPRLFVMVFDASSQPIKSATHLGRDALDVETLERLLQAELASPHKKPLPGAARASLADDFALDDAPAVAAPPPPVSSAREASLRRQLDSARAARQYLAALAAPNGLGAISAARMEDALPSDIWEHLMHSRTLARPAIIRLVSSRLLRPGTSTTLPTDGGAMSMIVGHCMSLQQARQAFGASLLIDEQRAAELGDEEHRYVPLWLCDRDGTGTPRVAFSYGLHSHVPEADMAMFTVARAQQASQPRVEIHSIDTDVLLLAMLHVARQRRQAVVPASTGEQQVYVVYQTRSAERGTYAVRFHANAMCSIIESSPTLGALHQPVETVVAAMLCGGSDYTDGYYYVPHQHMIEALVAEPRSLVATAGATMLDETAVRRLVHLAYHSAHARSMKGAKLGALQNTAIATTVAASVGARMPRKRVPDDATMHRQFLHLELMMRMWTQVSDVEVHVADPMQHGYALIDPTRGAVHGNLTRSSVVDDDADDDDEPLAKAPRV